MSKHLLLFFIVFLIVIGLLQSSNLQGQITWQRTYGGFGIDNGRCIKQVSEGGYVILGSTGSFGMGSSDFYFIKLDLNGEHEWSSTYGTPGVDQGWAFTEGTSGYALVGYTSGVGEGYDGLLIQTDHLGAELWRRSYGTPDWDFLYDIASNPNGYYLVGKTYSGSGNGDEWLLKIQENGDTIWTRIFGTEYDDVARSVRLTTDGGCIVAGTVGTANGSTDAVLTKFSGSGDQEWRTVLGGSSNDMGNSVTLTIDGGYVLGGTTESFSPFREMFMAKVGSNGVAVWSQHIGQIADWEGHQVLERADGGLLLVGCTKAFGAGGRDAYLLFTDAEGAFLFGKTYGGFEDDEGWSIDLTLDGGVVIAGSNTSSGPGIESMYVIKGDEHGDVVDPQDYPFFDPLPVTELTKPTGVSVSPTLLSPGEEMRILTSGRGTALARITDMRGATLALIPLGTGMEVSIQVPGLAPGPYLLSVEQKGEPPIVAKFVVMQ